MYDFLKIHFVWIRDNYYPLKCMDVLVTSLVVNVNILIFDFRFCGINSFMKIQRVKRCFMFLILGQFTLIMSLYHQYKLKLFSFIILNRKKRQKYVNQVSFLLFFHTHKNLFLVFITGKCERKLSFACNWYLNLLISISKIISVINLKYHVIYIYIFSLVTHFQAPCIFSEYLLILGLFQV